MRKICLMTLMAACVAATPAAHAQGFFGDLAAGLQKLVSKPKPSKESFEAASERVLISAFCELDPNGKEAILKAEFAKPALTALYAITPYSMTMRERSFSEGNMSDASATMRRYSASPLDDPIGQQYIQTAAARGNVVKLYRPSLGGALNRFLKQGYETCSSCVEWLGLDNALIEHAQDGSIVSIFTRSHQGNTTVGVAVYRYTNIYYGPEIGRVVENRISQKVLEDSLIRTLTTKQGGAVPTEAATAGNPTATTSTAAPGADSAPVSAARPPAAPGGSDPTSAAARRIQLLKELVQLRQAGAITEAEFEAEKKKILADQ